MGLLGWLRRKKRVSISPQFDASVAQRLAEAGKNPEKVQAVPAEALAIPTKPELPGFKGMVRLELTIDTTGTVRAVAMDGAPPNHVSDLESWAHGWRFKPAEMEGEAHPCRMVFEVVWT